MPIASILDQSRRLARLLPGAVLALPLVAAGPADAEIIPLADMMRGIEMTAAECAAKPLAVWVNAYGKSFCVRYYMSSVGGTGTTPVVYLSGDKLGVLDRRARTFTPGPDERDVDTDMLLRRAERMSHVVGTTAIYLARPGIDGSSGHHADRKSLLELAVVDAALEAIKRRHRFAGFHLVGQSGGSALVASLPAQRYDLGCTVAGAGPLSWDGRRSTDPAQHFADPSEVVAAIARNQAARVLVVTDPADQRVHADRQARFVSKLRAAGGEVDQFFVQATDRERHGVTPYSVLAAAECVRGATTAEIARKLADYEQRRVAQAQSAPSVAR